MSESLETASSLRASICEGKISAQEIANRTLVRIKKINPKVNALIDDDELFQSLNEAGKIDKDPSAARAGVLAGIPISFKDNISVRGRLMTAGSKILEGYRPPITATVAERILLQGGIYSGRCNLDEFAMGSTSETSVYGAVRNPWNLDYTAGGSSGGSAAAVAAGLTPISIGTDTGGSVRLPAVHCGVIGLKPTYGRLSRYGLVAYGSSLDQPGPIAKSVDDIKLVLSAMDGHDPKDATSVGPISRTNTTAHNNKVIARIPSLESSIEDQSIKDALTMAQKQLSDQGYKFESFDISLSSEELVAIYYIIALSEASSNLARFDGLRYGPKSNHREKKLEKYYQNFRGEGFGFEVKARIMMGTFCLSEGHYEDWFIKASRLRRVLKNNLDEIFKKTELILLPVSSHGPPKLGQFAADPTNMYRHDSFTAIANLSGCPALSLPMDFNSDGLPVGVQLLGASFCEESIFTAAKKLEEKNKVLAKSPEWVLDAYAN